MVKIDKIDKKILFYLDENSRYSDSFLAREVGLSSSNVAYRIERMKKNEIIDGFYVLLNPFAFRKRYDRLIVKFKAGWDMDDVREYCQKNKEIGWFIFLDGAWNLGCQIWSDDVIESKRVIDKFLSKFGETVDDYRVSSLILVDGFEHKFLFEDLKSKNTVLEYSGDVKLDSLDRELIGVLFRDARMKLLDVAEKLGVDYKVVSYRMKRLEEKKVILGYKLDFNRFNLGYDYYKVRLSFASYSSKDMEKLHAFLKNDKRILFVTKALGWADLEFEIFCKDQGEYREFRQMFGKKFVGVIREFDSLIPLEFDWNNFMP